MVRHAYFQCRQAICLSLEEEEEEQTTPLKGGGQEEEGLERQEEEGLFKQEGLCKVLGALFVTTCCRCRK